MDTLGELLGRQLFGLGSCFSIRVDDGAGELQSRRIQVPKLRYDPVNVALIFLQKVCAPTLRSVGSASGFDPISIAAWVIDDLRLDASDRMVFDHRPQAASNNRGGVVFMFVNSTASLGLSQGEQFLRFMRKRRVTNVM